jgi:putative transposase
MSTGVGSFEKFQLNEGGPTPVTPRVSPTEQLRAEIDHLFAESDEERQLGDTLEEVARLGARLLLQTALEAEVTEFLCRNRYGRRKLVKDARAGSRKGYGEMTVKTTAGPVTLKRPKLRGTTEQFASRLLGKGVTRTNALESLVIAGFVRGLSVRDVEAALAEALGPEATVSKSTVSRVCQAIRDEFNAFKRRDLSEVELEYLFSYGTACQVPRIACVTTNWTRRANGTSRELSRAVGGVSSG